MGLSVEDVQNKIEKSGNQRTALFIAAMAALLALCSMLSNDASKAALRAHIESSNQFAYFQAKNIRLHNYKIALDAMTASHPEKRAKIEEYHSKVRKYALEKQGILATARAAQAERARQLRRAAYFDYAIAALQIAIVIASASIVAGGGLLVGLSIVMTLVSLAALANGYFLFVRIPLIE